MYYLSVLYSSIYSDSAQKHEFFSSWYFMGLQTIGTLSWHTHTHKYIHIYMYVYKYNHFTAGTAICYQSISQQLPATLSCSRAKKKIKMMVLVLVCNLSQTAFGPRDHIFFLVKYATDWPSIISHPQSQNWLPEQRYHTLSTSNSDGSVIQDWLRVSRATDWTTLCHFSLRFKVSHPRSDTVQPVKLTRADKITARQ